MKKPNAYLIILIFALLHAVVAFAGRLIGFHNELVLTLLTMMMSVYLSLHKQMSIPFMVIAVILVNIAGMWLGLAIGGLVRTYLFSDSPGSVLYRGAISTFLTTCIIGVVQLEISKLWRRSRFYREHDTQQPIGLLVAFVAIILVRMLVMVRSSETFFENNVVLNIIIDYTVSFLAVIWMAAFAIKARQDISAEKKKRHEAQYSYERLKQQIEPHFLFNSLNSLDSIVISGQEQQASQFIHKLSAIYRYLIETEDERFVSLNDELHFVRQYIDLMQVRFPEGLEMEIDVPEDEYCHFVIPCSLQLLVENATKHNAISSETPLLIRISIEGEYVQVTNNLNPKISSQPSTGNGQRYIRKRYHDEAGKEIVVEENGQSYTVKLPLL